MTHLDTGPTPGDDVTVARRPFGRKGRHSDTARGGAPARDEELARALYDEHAAVLLSYTLRLTSGDRRLAEDVVAETLLRAWRSAGRPDATRGSLRPWLFTVARSIVVDRHRRRDAGHLRALDVSPLEASPAMGEIDRTLSALAINDALASLAPAHREVIVETYFRGLSVREAARALGLPTGTVKSRSYYGLRALRLALAERGLTSDA